MCTAAMGSSKYTGGEMSDAIRKLKYAIDLYEIAENNVHVFSSALKICKKKHEVALQFQHKEAAAARDHQQKLILDFATKLNGG